MLTLYSLPDTSALAAHIALEWSDVNYQVKIMTPGENRMPSYLELNSLGSVPALQLQDGEVLTEVAAILTYIDTLGADAFAAPARDALGHAKLMSCLSFFTSELHAAFGPHFSPDRFSPEPDHHETLKEQAYARIEYLLKYAENRFEGPFLFGEWRSVADPYLYVICRWICATPIDLMEFPAFADFKYRMEMDSDVAYVLSRYKLKH